MNYPEMMTAIEDARATITRADSAVAQVSRLIVGRLQKCDTSTLVALKKELRNFNIHTGSWKPWPNASPPNSSRGTSRASAEGTSFMKIYTCTTFTGHRPVGSAAVVIAEDAQDAADSLNVKLKAAGLKGDATAEKMIEFPADPRESIRILCDGDY